METIRTFIAIEIPEEIQRHLEKIESLLKAGTDAPVKWVEPENIHLTLKFLGDTAVSAIPAISEALIRIAGVTSPFALEVSGLGVFPNERKPRVGWVGLKGDVDRLRELAGAIETGLEAVGIRRETKGFSPHITLARVRDQAGAAEREAFGRLVAGTFVRTVSFEVRSFSLIRSELTKQGPIYTELASLLLK